MFLKPSLFNLDQCCAIKVQAELPFAGSNSNDGNVGIGGVVYRRCKLHIHVFGQYAAVNHGATMRRLGRIVRRPSLAN